ncbi:sensor histidine kinase [Nocardia fluminea]|uniref:sensor histidine kinase n=1 Tax=Nocardia fluminea TaxID=134984 RepID=UPI0033E1C21A
MNWDMLCSPARRVRVEAREAVRKGRPSPAEAIATVSVLVVMLAVASLRQGHFDIPARVLFVATVSAWVPLLLRTRLPLQVLAAVVVVESLHIAVVPFVAPDFDHPVEIASFQPVPLATMVAVWTVVTRTPRLLGWIAAITAAVTLLAVALLSRPSHMIATDMMMFDLVLITAGIATVVASSRDRAEGREQDKERLVEQAVIGERLRIARELHDVLAHNLALVNAQAGVAEYLLRSDPEAAATALRGITDHTGRAIDELRATVGLLRQDSDGPGEATAGDRLQPVPGLARLDELVETFRGAGTMVAVTGTGEPESLAEHSDLAVYRIVQEAVTNAAKHALGQPVSVELDWTAHHLRVRVSNPLTTTHAPRGPSQAVARSVGTGHGLIGMRERARAAGGTFVVTSTAVEYVIEATLPIATRKP